MTVAFVGAASAEATSLTLPTHQAGDLLVLLVARFGGAAAPVIPSGWSIVQVHNDNVGTVRFMHIAYRVATSSAEISGTWTDASMIMAAVYRDTNNLHVLAGRSDRGVVRNSTTVTYPAVQLASATNQAFRMHAASSVLVGAFMSTESTGVGSAAPSGMTNRATFAGASTGYLALHDTTSAVASWSATNVTAVSNINAIAAVAEIMDTGYTKSSGGGFRAVNIRGGADQ